MLLTKKPLFLALLDRGVFWLDAAAQLSLSEETVTNWYKRNPSLPYNKPVSPRLGEQLIHAHFIQNIPIEDLARITRRAPILLRPILYPDEPRQPHPHH